MEEEIGDVKGVSVDRIEERMSGEEMECEKEGDSMDVKLECEDDDDEFDSDSGMGSDDYDLLEVGGESGAEFVQVGDQTCSVPLELYDLSDLSEVLSLEVWNECLSKDEKLTLCKYLPDMDQGTFMKTLMDLLSGADIYFGNPVSVFFDMLKGGLCEPSVCLRRQGLMFIQKQQYYHFLRSYQNNMVSECLQIREVWSCCNAKSADDKIIIINEMRKQRRLEREKLQIRGLEAEGFRKDKNTNDALMTPMVLPKLMGARQKKKSEHNSRLALSNRYGYEATLSPDNSLTKTLLDTKVLKSELYRKEKYRKMSVLRSQDAINMDFYSKEDQNTGRKKGRLGRGFTVFNMNDNNNGKPFSPVSDAARNNDTESDSSDLRGEGAYGYCLNNITRHNKRKTVGGLPFDVAASFKKSVNIREHLLTVDNQTSNIKRKACNRDRFVSSESQCFLNDQAVNSKGLRTRGCQVINNYGSPEFAGLEDDALFEAPDLTEGVVRGRLNRGKKKNIFLDDICEDSNALMLQCSSVKKKSKGGRGAKKSGTFRDVQSGSLQHVELDAVQPANTYAKETEMITVEPDPAPQKKMFTLITPTVDCSFMFSVIHLLSAVRVALISPCLEDTLQHEIQEAQSMISAEVSNGIHPNEIIVGSKGNSERPGQNDKLAFSIHEIVNRVRSNPGDPYILETPEPLLELVRGVLKLFSSKSAPQGAKNWKPIAKYERASRSWSWIGPLNRPVSDTESIEEVTSPESWGIPYRMLVKLVDAFAIWLKNSQEALRELQNLPPPPASLMQFNVDEKERLKDLKAQKSLSTISPSTEEVRAYFRKEEYLRYSIPDRAFTYTAADGKKSTVAPLRRGGGNSSAKTREHAMLKSDRPAHVNILCLVRDAAARLPGSIGTRADVVTLIRDSQYISEDVTNNQVTHILSGALDRLHYEQDPCVKFEQERKLWVYLHRDRDEEDFDEDGTLSTKKWKKPKKEAADQPTDMVVVDGHEAVNMVAADQQLDLVNYHQSMESPAQLDSVCYQSMEPTASQLDLVSYQSVQASAPQLDLISYQSMEATAPQLDSISYQSYQPMEASTMQLDSIRYQHMEAAAAQFDLVSYQSMDHHNHESVGDKSGFNGAF